MALRLDLISILGAAFILGSNYAFVRVGEIDETTSPIVRYVCRFKAIVYVYVCTCVCICFLVSIVCVGLGRD